MEALAFLDFDVMNNRILTMRVEFYLFIVLVVSKNILPIVHQSVVSSNCAESVVKPKTVKVYPNLKARH